VRHVVCLKLLRSDLLSSKLATLQVECVEKFILLLELDVVLLKHQVDRRHAWVLNHVQSVDSGDQTLASSKHDEFGHVAQHS
jgi:hypothetical protein